MLISVIYLEFLARIPSLSSISRFAKVRLQRATIDKPGETLIR